MDLNFDINKLRRNFHIKLDLFDQNKFDNKEEDIKMVQDIQKSIQSTSKICFKNCVNLSSQTFKSSEEQCIKNCTNSLIISHEALLSKYDKANQE